MKTSYDAALERFDELTVRIKGAQDAAVSGASMRPQPSIGSLPYSPFVNQDSGMGTSVDKGSGTFIQSIYLSEMAANLLYQICWAAARMIDIPVDDQWIRGRRWKDKDVSEGDMRKMREAIDELDVVERFSSAQKAARLHGSSLLIVCTKDGRLDTPIVPEAILPGQIANLWGVDRWQCSVHAYHDDLSKPNYGKPFMYRVTPTLPGEQQIVHYSRVIRFDGRPSLNTEGWTATNDFHEREWGASELLYAIEDMLRDGSLNAGIGHLVQEASIFLVKIHGFNDAVRGRVNPLDPSLEEIALKQSMLKSNFRTYYMDATDDANRVNVAFSGLADLMNKHMHRLAAIAGIPATRFIGESPSGLNATGESDAQNYALFIKAMQEKNDKHLRTLDMAVARHAGLKEPPEYEWLPLIDVSDSDRAMVSQSRTQTILAPLQLQVYDEETAYNLLRENDELYATLGDYTPVAPDPNDDPLTGAGGGE